MSTLGRRVLDDEVLAVGAFRYVTGALGGNRPEAVAISTSYATVGIRGTDIDMVHAEKDAGGNEAGTYVKVNQGRKEEMRLLWKNQPHRKLPFRYGYPNHGSGEGHLMIMRPAGGAPVSGGDAQ